MMRVALVTGGTGFIGRSLLSRLLSEGWSVHCLHLPGTQDVVNDLVPRGLHLHPVTEDSSVWQADAAVLCPDVVFHLASLFRSEHASRDVAPLVLSNILFGTLLLDAVTATGRRRLVNIGTSWQHFRDADYDPVCLYAATKQAFEDVVEYYVQARGLDVVTLELFDTYGPGDDRHKLLPALMNLCHDGGHLGLSAGDQQVDLVHVDDVVAAILTAAHRLLDRSTDRKPEREPARRESFAVGTAKPVTVRELVALVERLSGSRLDVGWGERPYRAREVMRPWSHGQTLPGWTPAVSIENGLLATLQAAGCVAPNGQP